MDAVRHPRPGRADPVDLGASLTSRPRKRALAELEALTPGARVLGRPARPPRRSSARPTACATEIELVARPRAPRRRPARRRSSCVDETPDAELEAELDRERRRARDRLRAASGPRSCSPASTTTRSAILSISAGAGGTEATDWAEMLLRMYLRWAERHRFTTEIVDQQEGEQAGLKSVTVEVDGRCGLRLAARRARRPPPRPDQPVRRRRTGARRRSPSSRSCPEVDDDVEIELDWDEIRVDTFRSQGAGGQHVNKTDSAVRLTHLPTGIVAQSQNERSQTQNKETAIKVLKARLLERALEEKEAELARCSGEHVEAGWGNQIRSYVLHPYQMVKDLRTELRDRRTPAAVLDGDLDALHAGRARAARDRRRSAQAVRAAGRPEDAATGDGEVA